MARKAFGAYALVGTLLAAGYFVVPKGGSGYDLWYLCFGLSSVLAIVVGVRLNRSPAARAWHCVALGQLLFVAGDAVYLVNSLLGRETPYPSDRRRPLPGGLSRDRRRPAADDPGPLARPGHGEPDRRCDRDDRARASSRGSS